MISVSERAKAELKAMLVEKVDNPQACLRLKAGEGGRLGFAIDIEMPGDNTVAYEGATLLVVEPALAGILGQINIDIEDTEEGSQLVVVKVPK